MPRDRAASQLTALHVVISVSMVWLALAVPLGARQPDVRPIPPAITVTVQDPERPVLTTKDRVRAAAAYLPVILFWVGVGGGVGFSVWGLSFVIRMLPRRGVTDILFEDLSAGRDQRLDRNRLLTQSVLGRLQNAQPLATFDLQMDIMPGASEAGFGGLQPVLTMASVLNLERTDSPIKVGAVEFSLRDVLTLISKWFTRPPARYLEGWLIEANGSVEVGARMLDHRRRAVPKPDRRPEADKVRTPDRHKQKGTELRQTLAWVVRSNNGRNRAIADLAAQILVGIECSTLTKDWRSLRSFHEAMVLRDDQRFDTRTEDVPSVDPKAILTAARSHLVRAVSYDPSNWIARFSLAVTLCRDNEPHLALHHLEILKDAVTRAWPFAQKPAGQKSTAVEAAARGNSASTRDSFGGGPGFSELIRHLETLPQCAFLILFNEGIARATLKHDVESLLKARAVFTQLSDWMPLEPACTTPTAPVVTFAAPYDEIAPQVKEQSRTTLALYAMGAHASLIADTDRLTAPVRLEDHPVLALKRLLDRINPACRVQNAAHWPAAMSARAITLTALGHVLLNRKCLSEAQANFEEALAAEPLLVRALIGLADTYKQRADNESNLQVGDRTRTEQWLSRADVLLGRAMAINAGCADSKRLRDEVRSSRFFVGYESGRITMSPAIVPRISDGADANVVT